MAPPAVGSVFDIVSSEGSRAAWGDLPNQSVIGGRKSGEDGGKRGGAGRRNGAFDFNYFIQTATVQGNYRERSLANKPRNRPKPPKTARFRRRPPPTVIPGEA